MNGFFGAMVGNHLFGGRLYRNEHDFRRYYQERGGVGGFFGTLLSSTEFELFLCLLTGLICLNVIRDHLTTSPVTSAAILGMVALHFEKYVFGQGNTFLTSNNFNNYTFHPNRIMADGQWYRLWTGPMIHTSKLHLYLNMTALVALCHVEARNPMTTMQYTVFVILLMGLAGFFHCLVASKYKKAVLNTFTTGFSGIIFALKTVANCYEGMPFSAMNFPLIGDVVTYSLPVPVPTYAQVFCELFMVTILFPDVSLWSHIGGIVAGFTMVGLQKILFPDAQFFSQQPTMRKAARQAYGQNKRGYDGNEYSKDMYEEEDMEDYYAEEEDEVEEEEEDYEADDDDYDYKQHARSDPSATTTTTKGSDPGASSNWMEQVGPFLQEHGTTLILLAIITYLLYKMNDKASSNALPPNDSSNTNKEAEDLKRRLEELERLAGTGGSNSGGNSKTSKKDQLPEEVEHFHHSGEQTLDFVTEQDDSDLYGDDTRSIKSSASVTPSSVLGGTKDDDDDDDTDYDQSKNGDLDVISMDESLSFLTDAVPSTFATAMKKVVDNFHTSKVEKDVVIHSLTTMRKLIVNATTKGQEFGKEAAKFRNVRLSNPHISKCNIDGALDLMTCVGFMLTVDEYDEQFLVYPRQDQPPIWLPEALECLSQQVQELKQMPRPRPTYDKDDYRNKARLAALNRQASSDSKAKKSVNKKREGKFAAGLAGGDSQTIFYSSGT